MINAKRNQEANVEDSNGIQNMRKFNSNMNQQNESAAEVESIMCWNANGSSQDYMLDDHKLLLSDHEIDSLPSDSETQKTSLDILDNLLSTTTGFTSSLNNSNLAELKPLPPFTGYTGHLSINGISGHHYHAIAQRLPEENNNYVQNVQPFQNHANNDNSNIVSSSTCIDPDSVLSEGAENCLSDVKLFSENSMETKIYSTISSANNCIMTANHSNNPQNLIETKIFVDAKELVEYDMSSIEDIAAIIGSAIADTTVPNNRSSDNGDTRDSWMDLDAWIEDTVVPQDSKILITHNENLNEFLLPNSPVQTTNNTTLHNLLSQGYMPLLQSRLQNGPPPPPIKIEAQSTSYCSGDLISTSSPPGSVCSSTDLDRNNNRQNFISTSSNNRNFSHTITSSSTPPKGKKNRNSKKTQSISPSLSTNNLQVSIPSHSGVSSHGFQTSSDLNGLLGKEKPVHRCTICNRGFLNKSNIKVHLRTHTGEKPFRCETCAKAFRQKAHLIKHQQIHKRIGRD